MTEEGTVKRVQGSMAWVVTKRSDMCQNCLARSACHMLGGGDEVEAKVKNTANARVGDRVVIGLSETAMLKATFLVYLVPVMALFGGSLIGLLLNKLVYANASSDLLEIVTGSISFFMAIFWIKTRGNRLSSHREYLPEIVSIKPEAST
nr:hypothetical protein [Desulfobacterales bacterium]